MPDPLEQFMSYYKEMNFCYNSLLSGLFHL
jgi:hypothetical protein